ncbi:hypothetical protein ASE12_12440 [Aeromicrobium sp. Root236]|uniref:GAF and ANTAR domain-containing protein n=1 Tax=Aeromicrobium sp. Root236 TaxID=1736498 RepID=UPI0007018AE8|nr:GAF and ANTAR domain-containing protein [Aeromicrobium sp. Root236]KRC65490.1 hypothetical protein ASE12_12440 [Aeromicrobium sp. Root236]
MSETDVQRAIAKFATVLASLNHEESLTARLCEAGRRLLDAEGASMTLDYAGNGRLMVHATDELSAQLDDLQDVVGEGPSFDAADSGEIVVARLGNGDEDRWALFSDRLIDLGFRGTLVAVPLRAELSVLGVLSLHRRGTDQEEDLVSARFLGATVGTALLQDPRLGGSDQVANEAWATRSTIHQATGMIVAQVGVRTEDAMALLRAQAFARNTSLADVAQDIVDRRINFRDFTIEGD